MSISCTYSLPLWAMGFLCTILHRNCHCPSSFCKIQFQSALRWWCPPLWLLLSSLYPCLFRIPPQMITEQRGDQGLGRTMLPLGAALPKEPNSDWMNTTCVKSKRKQYHIYLFSFFSFFFSFFSFRVLGF